MRRPRRRSERVFGASEPGQRSAQPLASGSSGASRLIPCTSVTSGGGSQGVPQLGVVGDDRAAARLKEFAAGGKGRVGVERHESVPRDWATGVEGVAAATEPPADVQVGVVQLSDPGVGEDPLGVAAALPSPSIACQTARTRRSVSGWALRMLSATPPGPLEAGASSGRHQQHEAAVTRSVVECLGEGGQRAWLRPGGGHRRVWRASREHGEADDERGQEPTSRDVHHVHVRATTAVMGTGDRGPCR